MISLRSLTRQRSINAPTCTIALTGGRKDASEIWRRLLLFSYSYSGGRSSDKGGGDDVENNDGGGSDLLDKSKAPPPSLAPQLTDKLRSEEAVGGDLERQLRPSEVVTELDRHIVGQDDAKRAVAIAMRNRWRRKQLPLELRKEVTPRNVLMIGPTGCGKVSNDK